MDKLKVLYHYWRNKHSFKISSSKKRLRKWQQKQIRKHLGFVAEYSPYFRERFQGKVPSLQEWPIMDKEAMMKHFDKLNTKGIPKDEAFSVALQAEENRDFSPTINGVTVGLSSGTSGHRGVFLVSKSERLRWAGVMLAKALPGTIFTKERIAFFMRANSNLYETVGTKKLQFQFYDLLEDEDLHVKRLEDFQPTILIAPPSMMRWLAEQRIGIRPKKIITIAEVLEQVDRDVIKKCFHRTIHQVYQCTEGFLAATCEEGVLHLNEDILFIEKDYIDEEKKRFHPIITDFSRTSQPIIRYRLNDILVEKECGCSCGSPFLALEAVEGRSDDVFVFKGTEGGSHRVYPDQVRQWVLKRDGVNAYRVLQNEDGSVEFQLLMNGEERADVEGLLKKEVKQYLEERGLEPVIVRFRKYREPRKGEKLKRVVRLGGNDSDQAKVRP
ncbi:adenylate cyclase (plasmid) [Pontibacillus sp. ALD_SL1]|uniref:F390 synthetase-related protein n=1 Tax=Pontibacillus sp. ALD_SL1 TaxID=2777185 RepID=UPI001A960C12|nr:F390 synthetase-related protein [Pontibacillus sp. ALD_SL1]QST02104.1 adenylate cyclase [Pontibacillus sp. ALD_SL1]